jgi:hypothetical protein
MRASVGFRKQPYNAGTFMRGGTREQVRDAVSSIQKAVSSKSS